MFEQTKTSLKPFHGLYELVAGPFRDPSKKTLSFADKAALSFSNLYSAGAKEINGAQGAYMYPVIGLFRLFQIPNIGGIIWGSLTTGIIVSVVITIAAFVLGWAPQFALLSFIITPFIAFPASVILVLAEAWFISFTIAKLTWMEGLQEHVFDEIVQIEAKKDKTSAIAKGDLGVSLEKSNSSSDSQKKRRNHHFSIGRVVSKIRHYPKAIIEDIAEYLVTLPLNLIPGLGTALFLYVNSETIAVRYHTRYFELKGWKKDQSKKLQFIEEHEPAYRAFGFVAMLLNLIPVVNVFFAITNTVGAAVWACDIEKRRAARAKATKST